MREGCKIESSFSIMMICDRHLYDPRKVIIVDWDDTILPSTFVDRWQIENFRDLPLHVSDLAAKVDQTIDAFLFDQWRKILGIEYPRLTALFPLSVSCLPSSKTCSMN